MKTFYCGLFILTSFVLSSCEKNVAEIPVKGLEVEAGINSVVTITGLDNNDTLKNEVSATVKAIPGVKLEKIELFFNNAMIAGSTKEDLILKWNSLTIPDGSYALKIVVYTTDNKKYEVSRNLQINNALLKLDMPRNYSVGLTDIIITDKAGNILSNIKFPVSGNEILYPKDYFSSDNINVINVFKWGSLTAVKCDLQVKRGSSWQVIDQSGGYSVSSISVRLKNIPKFDYVYYSAASGSESFLNNISDTTSVFSRNLYYNPNNKLLVQLEKDNKAYYDFFDIKSGDKLITPDISNLKQESTARNISINGKDASLWISAKFDKALPYYNRICRKDFTGTTATYFYPGIKVDQYTSEVAFTNNGWRYNYLYKSLLPETIEPMNLSLNSFVTNPKSVSCDISGKFNYYTMDFYSTKSDATFFYSVTSCTAIKEFKMPDISSLISYNSFDFDNLEYAHLYVYDQDKFNPKILPYVDQFSLLDIGTVPVKIAQHFNPKFNYNILASPQSVKLQ